MCKSGSVIGVIVHLIMSESGSVPPMRVVADSSDVQSLRSIPPEGQLSMSIVYLDNLTVCHSLHPCCKTYLITAILMDLNLRNRCSY